MFGHENKNVLYSSIVRQNKKSKYGKNEVVTNGTWSSEFARLI